MEFAELVLENAEDRSANEVDSFMPSSQMPAQPKTDHQFKGLQKQIGMLFRGSQKPLALMNHRFQLGCMQLL